MDFEDTPEEAEFRAEAAAWLKENGVPKLSDQSMATRRGDPTVVPRAREWNAKKFEGGFAGISLPKEYGGRSGTRLQQIIFRRTQLCGTDEYLQHQPRYGGSDADDLRDGRAKAILKGTIFGASCTRAERVRPRRAACVGENADEWVINGQKIDV